jgi:excinuclease ABC subunit C
MQPDQAAPPHYNILLKDDKQYPFIRVTMQEDYPKIMLARKKKEDGSLYFGPYPGSAPVREITPRFRAFF